MKTISTLAVGMLTMTATGHADPLDGMRWTARPVVIVAPSPGDARLAQQRTLFDAKGTALQGYAIKVVVATGDDARRRWHVGPGEFATILVGKDGGEKGRWSAPVDPARIFAEIDKMPMRREEVRRL